MSHHHSHTEHEPGRNAPNKKRPIHHTAIFWIAVLCMLGAMLVYVL